MPYTNVWAVSNNPAGSDPAANADDDIRKVRLDIEERMDTLIGTGNFENDPVTPFGDENFIFVPWNDFTVLSGAAAWTAAVGSQYGISPNASVTVTLYAPLKLPRGVTVKELSILGQTHSAGTLTLTLESSDATTGVVAQATLATATMGLGVNQSEASSDEITVVLDSTGTNFIFYYLKLVMVSGAVTSTWFQGAKIKYTRANFAQAI